jgi:hypothetical protein
MRCHSLRRRYGHAAGAKVTIVLTWVEDESEFVGPEARVDLGERRQTRAVKVAKAALWKARGTAADVEKARAYAAKEGPTHRVFTYPPTDRDWKEHAKRDALEAAR